MTTKDNEKKYTSEQLRDAERMAKVLASVPEERRFTLLMIADAFMSGLEKGTAGAALAANGENQP